MSRYMSRDHVQGPDLNTIEGVVLQTYVSKLGLEVAWQDEEGRWGSRDPDTGAFNGVVGRVGRAEADVGISIISYTSERQEVVDYSHGITCHVSCVMCHVSRVRYRGGRNELDLEAPWQAAAQHQHRADIRPLLLDHDRLLPGRSQVGAVLASG